MRFALKVPAGASQELIDFAAEVESAVVALFRSPIPLPEHTIAAGLPAPADWAGCAIIVPDETGGRTIATCDGVAWERVSDGATAS